MTTFQGEEGEEEEREEGEEGEEGSRRKDETVRRVLLQLQSQLLQVPALPLGCTVTLLTGPQHTHAHTCAHTHTAATTELFCLVPRRQMSFSFFAPELRYYGEGCAPDEAPTL